MAKALDRLDGADRPARPVRQDTRGAPGAAGPVAARRTLWRQPATLACAAGLACAALPGAAWPQVGIRPAALSESTESALPAPVPAEPAAAAAPDLGLLTLAAAGPAAAADAPAAARQPAGRRTAPGPLDRATLARRNTLLLGSAVGSVLAYGAVKWWDTGFDRRADFEREGFFGRGTRYGGIDKLGHAYSNYAAIRLLTPVLEWIGNDPVQARTLAFWTTLGTFAGVEVLDAYSKQYRASWEDMLANLVGSTASLVFLGNPALDRLVDLRFGYKRPRGGTWDPTGDYEGQFYVLVLKAEGIRGLENHPVARYLEMSVGYAARGFDPPAGTSAVRRRELQVGVSLNLSRLLADVAYGGQRGSTRVQRAADLAFELVQFPVRAHGRVPID